MSEEHIINNGTQEYTNPETIVANSYTFGEPLELTIQKLARRVDLLEARVCPDCPGAGNGCCKD